MADWNGGSISWLTKTWAAIETLFAGLWTDCATMFANSSSTNFPADTFKWNKQAKRFEIWDLSVPGFVEAATEYAINVTKLKGMSPDTAATGNTIVQRDASGRVTVAAPSSTSHAARKADVDAVASALSTHTGNNSNPHGTTKAHVQLGNVTNDAQFAISRNLSEGNAATMRENLGLKTAALRDVGTTNGTLVLFENIPQPDNATTAKYGLTRLGLTSEHTNGSSSVSATPAGVNQMGFLRAYTYESEEFTFSLSSNRYLGSVSGTLFGLQVWARCKISELGWGVGQEVPLSTFLEGAYDWGAQAYQSGSALYLAQTKNGVTIISKTNYNVVAVTPDNWRLFVRALRVV